jgi:DNA-binding transcriptional LysR family regulator
MRGFNPDHLKALLEVVEQGSFTAAARRLNLSQPAVSIQIRDLEERCGVQLIERAGRKPILTAAGEELVVHAKRLVKENEAAVNSMRRFKSGSVGRVRIGMSTTMLIYTAGKILRDLRRDHPSIELSVVIGTSQEHGNQVRDNDLDIGIVTMPIETGQLAVTPMMNEELVAILPVHWKDIPDVVTPSYFKNRPLVLDHRTAMLRRLIVDWLDEPLDIEEDSVHLSHLEAIKGGVAAGLGASIVPAVMVRTKATDGLVVRPLKPRIVRDIAIVRHQNKALTEPMQITIRALQQAKTAEK